MGKGAVLITGASGLIGSRLTPVLREQGFDVRHLGRQGKKNAAVPEFMWDIPRRHVDNDAFAGVETIVHLAGASVAPKRWTESRKRVIYDSRVDSTRLLYDKLSQTQHSVRTLICASGVNYYGYDGHRVFTEVDPAGDDFLSRVTQAWEHEAEKLSDLGIRVVRLRIGMVLSGEGGALSPLALPVKFFVGAPLGSGKQHISWIHIDDLCGIVLLTIENTSMAGPYNAVAPRPVTNKEMTDALARALNRRILLPRIPEFAIRGILGEMADIVVRGSKVSCDKVVGSGYQYVFPDIDSALADVLNKRGTQ